MDNEFEALKQEFLAEAADKVVELRKLCENGGPRDEDEQSRLMNLAHQLKGAGGSYGYDDISKEAAEVEELLEGTDPDFLVVGGHLDRLDGMIAKARGSS